MSGTVVELVRMGTLDDAVAEIERAFDESDNSPIRVKIGQLLVALRTRIRRGDAGKSIDWWEYYALKFTRSRKDAEKCMRLALSSDPKAAVATERAEARERMAAHRKRGANVRSKKGTAPVSDPIQEECADCNTDEERWHQSLSNLAGDAISLRAFWTRQFGKDWQKFDVPQSLVTLAKQAAEEWKQVASELAERVRS